MKDVVSPCVLGRQGMLDNLTELEKRLVRDVPLVVTRDRVQLKNRVKISIAIRHVETVLVD